MSQQRRKASGYLENSHKEWSTGYYIPIVALIVSTTVVLLLGTQFGDHVSEVLSASGNDDLSNKIMQQVFAYNLWVVGINFVNVVVAFFMLIYFSHRVFGPLAKIKRVLSEAAEGKRVGEVVLRKHDKLQDMAIAVNKLLGSRIDRIDSN